VDLHISPSEYLKCKLKEAFPKIRVAVVRNPCVSEDALPARSKVRNREIVYFGRISREKGIVEFARLFATLNTDYRLQIIGKGKLSKDLEKIHSPNIQYENSFMPASELYKTIHNAKFSVLPAVWYENSPVSVVESVKLGIVPIVSNWGGMAELVDLLGVGIKIDMKNKIAVADMISRLDDLNDLPYQARNLNLFTDEKFRSDLDIIYCAVQHQMNN
jgi:glycosyltransferase involved in cell wall biosynthesis